MGENMNWKETVKPIPSHSEGIWCPHCGEEFGIESKIEYAREAQAEISFSLGEQQGIEKVVQWVEKHKVGCMIQDKDTWWHGILDKDWQAFKESKLKEAK